MSNRIKEKNSMNLMTVEDLERETQVSRHTWRLWIRQGKVPVVRLGRRVRVREEDFKAFVEKNRVPSLEE